MALAATTRARTISLDSPASVAANSVRDGTSTKERISIRSSSGPDSRCRYLRICRDEQVQARPFPLYRPHGHGLAASTKRKSAGNVTVPLALEMETDPDSRGCLSESKTPDLHSGASSINKTPRCAMEQDPGLMKCAPPPTIATVVVV